MADTKISALSAGTALAGTEEIPGVQSAATVKFTPAQIRTYVQANMTAAVIASGTLTADANALTITQTWNNAGVTFSAALVNVTDTASVAASKLLDLQVAGTTKFNVDKTGKFTFGTNAHFAADSGGYMQMGAQGNGFAVSVAGSNILVASGTSFDFQNLVFTNIKYAKINAVTVASLVAAATAGAGARCTVTDATAPTFGATVVGGGAVVTPVYSDGSNWKVG